jgi:hypothetical protein
MCRLTSDALVGRRQVEADLGTESGHSGGPLRQPSAAKRATGPRSMSAAIDDRCDKLRNGSPEGPDRTGFGEMRAFSGLVGVDLPTFDDIKPGARLRGLDPAGLAEVVQVARFGADALNLVFRVDGRVGERLVYRGEESSFEFVEPGRAYAFDADGGLLRLASEAYRIRLAHLFDPYLAVSASQIEALPHQITAVYGEMLPRQPLRFLLADDPGAGKTIMAGLLIKELLIRGDLERCLIVAPDRRAAARD